MLREILIAVPTSDRGVNVAEDDAAKAKAEEIRHRVLGGEPFARLAAEVSDAPSKANGGLIGPINSDELAPALQTILQNIKVGEVPMRSARSAATSFWRSNRAPRRRSRRSTKRARTSATKSRKRAAHRDSRMTSREASRGGDNHLAQRRTQKAYEQALAERRKMLEAEQAAPAKS